MDCHGFLESKNRSSESGKLVCYYIFFQLLLTGCQLRYTYHTGRSTAVLHLLHINPLSATLHLLFLSVTPCKLHFTEMKHALFQLSCELCSMLHKMHHDCINHFTIWYHENFFSPHQDFILHLTTVQLLLCDPIKILNGSTA